MLGKIFKNILILFLGIIIGIGAVAGGGYLVVTKMKIGTVTDKLLPPDQQYVGEELKNLSILAGIQKLTDVNNNTLKDYQNLVPMLKTTLTDLVEKNLGKYVMVDFDKLDNLTISNIGSGIGEALSIVVTLDTLKTMFNFEIPALPLFSTVVSYVKISSPEFVVKNKFYLTKENLPNIYYNAATPETGVTYTAAYGADGALVAAAKNKDLFFKATGISAIPVTDAITSLSSVLNFNTLTLGELETNFGINILNDKDGKPTVLSNIFSKDDVLNSLSADISTKISGLKISQLGITVDNTLLKKILGEGENELSIGELTTGTALTDKIPTFKISDLGITMSSPLLTALLGTGENEMTIGQLTTGNTLDNKIKTLTMKDLGFEVTGMLGDLLKKADGTFLKIGELTDPTVLDAQISNMKLSQFGIKFAGSVIATVLGNDDPTVKDLKGTDFDKKINDSTLQALGITLSGLALKIIPATTKISDLKNPTFISENIDKLPISELDLNIAAGGIMSQIITPTDTILSLKNKDFEAEIGKLTMENLGLNLTGIAGDILKSTTTIADLKSPTFLPGEIDKLYISAFLKIAPGGIMSKIIAPTDKVSDLKGKDFEAKIKELPIGELGFNIAPGGIMSKIIDPSATVGSLKGIKFEEKINALSMADLDINFSSNPMMSKILSSTDTIGGLSKIDFTARVNDLDVKDIFGDATTGIMSSLLYKHDAAGNITTTPTKISEIDNEIKYLPLSAILGKSSTNTILQALLTKGSTINSLATDINSLKITDVFTIEVFSKPTTITTDKMVFTYNPAAKTYTETTYNAAEASTYYQITDTASVWLFMLYGKTGSAGNFVYTEKASVGLMDMTGMVSGVGAAFGRATMTELFNIGMLSTKPNAMVANLTLSQIVSMP